MKQLLGKKVTDRDIRNAFPASWNNEEFQYYADKYRDQLADREIIIYCCGECGDYDCGGITVKVDRNESSVFWTITDEQKHLIFEFNKHLYFDVLNNYLQLLEK